MIRFGLALKATHPGHGDYAFYYTLAQNIVSGRGFVIDYIWQYLTIPATITHNAVEFWMPLSSVIMAGAMAIAGKSLFVALLPGIICGLSIPILIFFWSRRFSESRFVQYGSAGLALFLPTMVAFSLLTDSTIYYVLFITAAFLAISKAQQKPGYFLASAACIGLAHLTRQDSILLLPVLIIMIFISSVRFSRKLRLLILSLIVYAAIFSPVWISNLRHYGVPLSPGPSKAMYITSHEDLYSYGKDLTWRSYSAWGIKNILSSKAKATIDNFKTLYDSAGGPILILALAGLFGLFYDGLWRNRWRLYLPPFLYSVIILLFYSIVVPFNAEGGAFSRSVLSICPFLVIIAVDLIDRQFSSRKLATTVVMLIGFYSFGYSTFLSSKMVNSNNQLGLQLSELKVILGRQAPHDKEIIVMTRNPWELYYSTGYRAIQIPNNDIDTICLVAQRYQANYLILPAPRPALDNIFSGDIPDPRFEKIDDIPKSEMKLFRIK
jgi:4-amino-4-deoxy-L-arabinose transferase-like glycosyltransferase